MTGTADTAAAWRCFVGIPLGASLRAELEAAVTAWRDELDASWTDPAGWHCSVDFLGDLAPSAVEPLAQTLCGA
ncbi:MAG: RNA 2',3'-cyclic phosphodiesterase, partial [Chloroflexota bacterium]|nr:RNA 2',3'-cyclic phosphodiesterase [Chloroflexota bacterium]